MKKPHIFFQGYEVREICVGVGAANERGTQQINSDL